MKTVHNCPTCGARLLFSIAESYDLKTEIARWIEGLSIEGKSFSYIRNCEQRARDYILPFFARIALSEIRSIHVRDFYRHLLKLGKLASKTVKHVLDTLKAFLVHMAELEVIASVPMFPKVKVIPVRPKVWIDAETQARVVSFIPKEHKLLFKILIETGIRPGEVCALKKKDIEGEGLMIRRAVDCRGLEKTTKTGAEFYRAVSPGLSIRLWLVSKSLFPDSFLFVREGKRYNSRFLYSVWRSACKKAGVTICLYQAVRHSLVSKLRKELEGSMHETLRKKLGHTSAGMTMKAYALPASSELRQD